MNSFKIFMGFSVKKFLSLILSLPFSIINPACNGFNDLPESPSSSERFLLNPFFFAK